MCRYVAVVRPQHDDVWRFACSGHPAATQPAHACGDQDYTNDLSPSALHPQAAIQSAQDPDWYDDDYGWAPDGQGPPHTGLGDKFHEEGTRVIKLEAPRGSLLGSPPAKTLLVRPV